jgi:transcriptional regulator with XRE-family HTH domain
MSNVYNIIASLCEDKGVSSYRMCKDIGMQPSVMTDLKKGRKQTLHPDSLRKIATYFNVSVDYLLGNEKSAQAAEGVDAEPSEYEKRMKALNDKIALLSDSKRAVLESLLDAMLEDK